MNEIIKAKLRLQPDILFEDTREEFRQSPFLVKQKGCLHSSWSDHTEAISLLEASEEGIYHKTHLKRVGSISIFVDGPQSFYFIYEQ